MVRHLFAVSMLAMAAAAAAPARANDRVALDGFAIDRTETTIGAFRAFIEARRVTTAAERDGGGFEFAGGWIRRPGWSWATPFGRPGADDEPAVHVSWQEASDYCAGIGGRLPTLDEWQRAAHTEMRANPSDGFVRGRSYAYPVGDSPEGMNAAAADPWPRHAPAGGTRRGVNGLQEMGANVWEWLADRRGDSALTAGGSWWYGPDKARADAAQWKPADFYAVYVGFRCVYDLDR
jgi:formylglycine-generating enzyme required for sulfatase activity